MFSHKSVPNIPSTIFFFIINIIYINENLFNRIEFFMLHNIILIYLMDNGDINYNLMVSNVIFCNLKISRQYYYRSLLFI